MMAIKLDKDYYITADTSNITLCTKKAEKKPQEERSGKSSPYATVGYYSSVLGALEGYRKIKLREAVSESKSLDELWRYMKAFDAKLAQSLKWEKNFSADINDIAAKLQAEAEAAKEAGEVKAKKGAKAKSA